MPNTRNRKRSARERVAEERARQRQAERRRNLITIAIVVAIVVAGAGGIAWYLASKNGGGASAIGSIRTFTGLSRNHVSGKVTYRQTPPVGGPHSAVFLNCGIYTSPVPNENAIHSLEHGAVWITYRPGLSASNVRALQGLVRGEPQAKRRYTILSPYRGLPAPVVASAWGKQMRLNSATDPRLQQFVSTYAAGPQAPEPGAACSGGTGTPAA